MFSETPFQLTLVTSTFIDAYKHLDEDQRRFKMNISDRICLHLLYRKNERFDFFSIIAIHDSQSSTFLF